MKKIQVGQQVALASMPNCVFIVAEAKIDGSYVIETQSGSGQKLSYGNVSAEMLRVLESN